MIFLVWEETQISIQPDRRLLLGKLIRILVHLEVPLWFHTDARIWPWSIQVWLILHFTVEISSLWRAFQVRIMTSIQPVPWLMIILSHWCRSLGTWWWDSRGKSKTLFILVHGFSTRINGGSRHFFVTGGSIKFSTIAPHLQQILLYHPNSVNNGSSHSYCNSSVQERHRRGAEENRNRIFSRPS